MRIDILQGNDADAVKKYLQTKFKNFNSWTYLRDRDKKCIEYWLCASAGNKVFVESAYSFTFKRSFPKAAAEEEQRRQEKKASGPAKVSSSDWVEMQEDRQQSAELLLDKLSKWKETGEYQGGDAFFLEMRSAVSDFDPEFV